MIDEVNLWGIIGFSILYTMLGIMLGKVFLGINNRDLDPNDLIKTFSIAAIMIIAGGFIYG